MGAGLPSRVRLRAARDDDWPLIRSWLKQPEVARWWGSLAAAECELRIAAESEGSIRCIIECDGVAAGYAQAVDASFTGDEAVLQLPPGTWDMSLFIGARELRGQGLGLEALRRLATEVFGTTLALALSVLVSLRNEHAVRIYEKAGFRWTRVIEDPLFGPSWLMILDRPAA